ncbi:MAG: amidohydrolase family protein [Gammaproteobacteria bacterium]|jgi:predicted TIM-barrel fold metal-dependent hydrolase
MPVLLLLLTSLFATAPAVAAGPAAELFDGHIHYNSDVWDKLSPRRALELLSEVGITRALVSATPGEGAERLYRQAPDRVIPFLRPYMGREHRYTWFRDAAVPEYLREQLGRIPYRGIGEFHLSGDDAYRPVVRDVLALAAERGLAVQAHTDPAGIRALLDQAPEVPLIWAHGGFDAPETLLRDLLSKHPNLYIELSFREGLTEQGKLTPVWRELFTDFPQRFLVGMDTYSPRRWVELPELAAEARAWLSQLPDDVARDIAYGNAARLFATEHK